jgi:transposase-like protein
MDYIETLFNFYQLCQKKSCWGCGSKDVIKWGRQNNKQRFKCKQCGLLFTWKNEGVKTANRRIWFEKWISNRYTLTELEKVSGIHRKGLQRLFKTMLSCAPQPSLKVQLSAHYIIDATYFDQQRCLLLYRNQDLRFTQLIRFSDKERYREIKQDLKNLIKLGIVIESVTCDGHKAILKAVKEVYPQAIIQRCYVHVQRMVRTWLTKRPRLQASQKLRFLIGLLHQIKTPVEKQMWLIAVQNWYSSFENIINEKVFNPYSGRWWYKHKKLRQSASMTMNALPDLFHHLDNPKIPGTTNALESFFAHLKGHLNVHRGLAYEQRMNYIKWYLHLKNQQQ